MRCTDRGELAAADRAAGPSAGPTSSVDGATIDSRAVATRAAVRARRGRARRPRLHRRRASSRRGGGLPDRAAARRAAPPIVVADTARRSDRARAPRPATGWPTAVVGITGSVGKTSVKDLLAAAWPAAWRTAASVRSFNNELGVPLTLLERARRHRGGGGRDGRPGRRPHRRPVRDRPARPSASSPRSPRAHTEVFGTIDDVARAKGELVEALPADGTAVLNADDERVAAMAARTAAAVLTFGGRRRRAGRGRVARRRPAARVPAASRPWGDADVAPRPCAGATRSSNALAPRRPRLAVRRRRSTTWPTAWRAAALSPWRMELRRGRRPGAGSSTTPTTPTRRRWRPRCEALAALPAERRIAVLGTMAELGRPARRRAPPRSPSWPRDARASASSPSARRPTAVEDVAVDRRGASARLGRPRPTATPSWSRAAGWPASSAWPTAACLATA